MKNLNTYILLNNPRGINRLSWKPLLFGIIVGLFLSKIVIFESEIDADSNIYQGISKRHEYMNNNYNNSVYLRCLILIQFDTIKVHKFIESVRDTYSKRCDEALYFTSNKQLEKQFASDLNIYHLEYNLDARRYSIIYEILNFISAKKSDQNKNIWTVILNEQNYVVVENLKIFLSQLSTNSLTIAGKIVNKRSFFDYLFPSDVMMFQLDAGIVLSSLGIKQITQDDECYPYKWSISSYGGKALFQCAVKNNFEIWDPIDEENKSLFIGKSPRTLFSKNNYASFGEDFDESQLKSDCCSDKAAIFGNVNYKDQRVIEYALEKIRVFG